MQDYYEFLNRVKIVSGIGSLEKLGDAVVQSNIKKPLLITGPVLTSLGIVDKIKKNCKVVKNFSVFSETPNDSSTDTVDSLVKKYRADKCDGIIAVGGGSVLDTAKAVKLVLSQEGEHLLDYAGMDSLIHKKSTPLIVIPTTAGTGSEVTKVCVISDAKRQLKMEFITKEMLPNVCILDANLTETLPEKATFTTAIDALTHAIEGYTSTQRNEICIEHGKLAVKTIFENLPKVMQDHADADARQNLLEASQIAGVCFSNSMVGLVHAVAHGIGAVSGLPHDKAITIALCRVLSFNEDKLRKYYAEFLLIMQGAKVFKETIALNRGRLFIEKLREMLEKYALQVGMSLKLSDYGVKPEDLEKIASTAIVDGAIMMNIKNVVRQDILDILVDIL